MCFVTNKAIDIVNTLISFLYPPYIDFKVNAPYLGHFKFPLIR